MKNVFVALDNMQKNEILDFLGEQKNYIHLVKIGLEVYLKYGQEFIKELAQEFNFKIFLDLKLHDIPNTVASAIKSLQGLEIDFLTIHLSGGKSMIDAALKARDQYLPKTKIIGVSILTSIDETECLEIYKEKSQQAFLNLIKIASQTKVDGIVCSGNELEFLSKDHCFITICPGIRLEDDDKGDQKRVMTPQMAIKAGAQYLVMGRSIRNNAALMRDHQYWSSIYK